MYYEPVYFVCDLLSQRSWKLILTVKIVCKNQKFSFYKVIEVFITRKITDEQLSAVDQNAKINSCETKMVYRI